jgi:diguanylate cyclase (GGDEF)-like protein
MGPSGGISIAIMVPTLALGLLIGRKVMLEQNQRETMVADTRQARQQLEHLFAMTDLLQSADGHDDAAAVLVATFQRLLPDLGGALYIFNNSRDRLDFVNCWNTGESFTPAEALLPSNCWALKCGKPQLNDPAGNAICCRHHCGEAATLEIPMTARGTVHGLMILICDAGDAAERLGQSYKVARALADSMSLALSNITLREKLFAQSLRDPLTGLYNRRYMEDALDRLIGLGERAGTATSVLMIDLDNFKQLNDQNGHAKGDAVLRDVAAQLVGGLRPSDVISRYGGEELVVILPSCGVDDAMVKAEALRARIEGLSEVHGIPVSASIGIASVPETATNAADVVPMADNALYAAKQSGKNRVHVADRRGSMPDGQLRLAVG